MSQGILYVVGAGLAGLAAAVAAAKAGTRVVLFEAAGHAGGRCRSFRDDRLDRVIDNGSHLVLGANRTALAYAHAIGGHEAMVAGEPAFPFVDIATGARWSVSPKRLPAGLGEILKVLGLPWIGKGQTVAERMGKTRSFRRLWQPMCEAIMNTAPEEASASMFAWTMRRALLGGASALVPYTFPLGLSAAFVAPALATLSMFGAEIHFRHRLTAATAAALIFEERTIALQPDDRVILALPPWALESVLPDAAPPTMPTRPIVNAHFRLAAAPSLPGGGAFLGMVNSTSHWIFVRDDVLSITVSAADALADRPNDDIAALLWEEVARALGTPAAPVPPVRILKERRATLAHDCVTIGRRPGAVTGHPHLFLAGDWIETPWPCTIEAAISSGLAATRLALGQKSLTFTG